MPQAARVLHRRSARAAGKTCGGWRKSVRAAVAEQCAQTRHQAGQDDLAVGNGGGEARVRYVHEHLPVLEIVMDDTQAISQRLRDFSSIKSPVKAVPGEQPGCVDVAKS